MEKVLSKEAEQFVMELRMYLLSKGKNEKEIDEITTELEDHLLQAEAEGKSIQDITGDSPREYMKSVGQEMRFDKESFLTLVPMSVLLVIAFLSFTSALWGDFTLSKISVWGLGIVTILSFIVYGFLLVRVFPRVFYSNWFYIIYIAVYFVIFGSVFIIELLDNNPFYVATPMQNNLIVAGCILIFIVWAFYAKTWITIIIPFIMSLGPLADKILPPHIKEDPFYVTIGVILFAVIAVIGMIISYYVYRKERDREAQ